MLLSDLRELKALLEIDPADTSEDKKLHFLIEIASGWIEEVLGRPGLSHKSRTEYYSGNNTQRLPLRSRPVFTTPTIELYLDESGWFGSVSGSFNTKDTKLVYGDDFTLLVDQENGTSRSGILVRIDDVWQRPNARRAGLLAPFVNDVPTGNIKVIYTAGYTVDTLPTPFRLALTLLVARLRQLLPLGFLLNSESYEERSISMSIPQKNELLSLITPMIWSFRNWRF